MQQKKNEGRKASVPGFSLASSSWPAFPEVLAVLVEFQTLNLIRSFLPLVWPAGRLYTCCAIPRCQGRSPIFAATVALPNVFCRLRCILRLTLGNRNVLVYSLGSPPTHSAYGQHGLLAFLSASTACGRRITDAK